MDVLWLRMNFKRNGEKEMRETEGTEEESRPFVESGILREVLVACNPVERASPLWLPPTMTLC